MDEEFDDLSRRTRRALDWLRPNPWLDEWIPTPRAARDLMLEAFDAVAGGNRDLRARTRRVVRRLADTATSLDAELDGPTYRESGQLTREIFRQLDLGVVGSSVRWGHLAAFTLIFLRGIEHGDTPLKIALESLGWDRVPSKATDLVLACCRCQAAAWPLAPIDSAPFDHITAELVRIRATYYFYAWAEDDPGVVLNVAALWEKGAEIPQANLVLALRESAADLPSVWDHLRPADLASLPPDALAVAVKVGTRASRRWGVPDEKDEWLTEAARLTRDRPALSWPIFEQLAELSLERGVPQLARSFARKAEASCVRAGQSVPENVRRLAHAEPDRTGRLATLGLPEDLFLWPPFDARRTVVDLIARCIEEMGPRQLAAALEHMADVCEPSDACVAPVHEARAELALLRGDHGAWCEHTRLQLAAQDRCGIRPATGERFEAAPSANQSTDGGASDGDAELFVFDPIQRAEECRLEATEALERGDIPTAEFWRDMALGYGKLVRLR